MNAIKEKRGKIIKIGGIIITSGISILLLHKYISNVKQRPVLMNSVTGEAKWKVEDVIAFLKNNDHNPVKFAIFREGDVTDGYSIIDLG